MRRAIFTLFLILSFITVSSAQVSVNFFEVPFDWGIESVYWAEADTGLGIPVNLGSPGGNQSWDYSNISSANEFSQTIVSADSTPYGNEYPNANMVMASDDLSQFGFEGPGFIYYAMTPNSLNLLGIGLEFGGMQFPLVFEEPLTWFELPLDYQDDWSNNLYMEIPFDSAGMEYRIDISLNFDFAADAWGELIIPLGNFDALRVRNDIDIEVEVNLMLFGIPIPVMTENFNYISYIWVSEYLNMNALIMSQMGETNPNFTNASSFAVMADITFGDISAYATAANPPVQIPAGGGNFTYEVDIYNNLSSQNVFDVWMGVFLPNGSYYGPVFLRPDLNMQPNSNVFRNINQNIPGNAPAGTYHYTVFAGDASTNTVQSMGGFTFEKLGTDGIDSGWEVYGWDEEFALTTPTDFALNAPYPNPFNPVTTISFELASACNVTLDIFDVTGRSVRVQQAAPLQNQYMPAGSHQVVFDAEGMTSGVYFVRLEVLPGAGTRQHSERQTRKMLLIK